jgi:hypothetical protein
MTAKADQSQASAGERRRRKRARARRRAQDRVLVPVAVAQRLGIPVADIARAMRAAGIAEQITQAQARQWSADPESVPQWLARLRGEQLASAAESEYRRQQEAERRELHELVAGQSARAKVRSGKRRFTDDEWLYVQDWAFRAAKDLARGGPDAEVGEFDRDVLRAVGADADDHATWPVHAGGCDGEGDQHCSARIEQIRAQRRVNALIHSVAKQTALRGLALAPGQFVTTWHGARAGLVVKVSKVTVKVRMIGGRADKHAVVEKNLDPRHVHPAPASLPKPPETGDEVVLRDHGGHIRPARVVEVNGPLFEATYSLRSGQWRSDWFDLLAICTPTAGAP